MFGMAVWVVSGILFIAWGYHTKSRGIMVVNLVNVAMAVSGIVGVLMH
jgi:hypothetical protein